MPRIYEFARLTTETNVKARLNLDGSREISVETGFGLLDHMLTLTFFWANMDLSLKAEGDLHIDAHHTTEDIGIVLGTCLHNAIGYGEGIRRVGFARVPMDEALCDVAVDLSGRPYLVYRNDDLLPPLLGGQEKDIWREFYKSFAMSARCNLHISFCYGKNGHHLLESLAKGLGLALESACGLQGDVIRSTKGGFD